MLASSGLTISLAESSTGGYIGHLLNGLPGSSKYFVGGIVAYHNKPKVSLLKVPQELLEAEGAVSFHTALAMARGVREALDTDIGVSETGTAGPGGGTPEKPVGTAFIAISARDKYELSERYLWKTDRQGYKDRTAEAVLDLVKHYLARKKAPPL